MPQAGVCRLALYSLGGRLLTDFGARRLTAGQTAISLTPALPSGASVLKISGSQNAALLVEKH
jgi:hypothetical protein